MLKLLKFIAGTIIVTSAMAMTARAEAVVNVTLIDKAGTSDLSKSANLGMGMKGDMKTAKMGININPMEVSHGNVKFNVTNLASTLVHEVILAQVADESQLLTYDATTNQVSEGTIQTLGQLAELYPNKAASMTLELKPGKYVLYCNYPGHFMAGMWTVIEVK